MTPTPEQVAQWALEAGGFAVQHHLPPHPTVEWRFTVAQLDRLVTRAMAEHAEADANAVRFADNGTEAEEIIRANAPKLTT